MRKPPENAAETRSTRNRIGVNFSGEGQRVKTRSTGNGVRLNISGRISVDPKGR